MLISTAEVFCMRAKRVSLAASVCVFMAAAISPAAGSGQTGEPLVLEPRSAWHASHENGLCRLARAFGSEGYSHTLIFEQTTPGALFNLTITGPALSDMVESTQADVGFGSAGPEGTYEIAKETNREFGHIVFMTDVSLEPVKEPEIKQEEDFGLTAQGTAVDPAKAKAASEVAIRQGRTGLTLKTGSLAAPMGVLNDCTAHILSTWGLDPAKHKGALRGVSLLQPRKVSQWVVEKYPQRALQEKRQGVVGLAVIVDEAGQPTECKITDNSGHTDLNNVACEGMMRARYAPAIDADGQPMPSFFVTRIVFGLG
ncbi:TonB family protein [Erythrobacter sp. sf7]|uniref:TonB family protein n=1 Tax=Erythrobacter fulvus TaxID=2987523 RepID=A0ABT5JM37_9SPHN|nr:energy transducer TonB [Erythrobacter fulvus]MDC8753811.1 TonB family protein [Erythrobacter fulvus]